LTENGSLKIEGEEDDEKDVYDDKLQVYDWKLTVSTDTPAVLF
jgi:hypothetical protein